MIILSNNTSFDCREDFRINRDQLGGIITWMINNIRLTNC
jgi:hypothetical protein